MLAKRTSKNRITFPRDIVKNFPDIAYFDVVMDNDRILLRPVKFMPSESTLEKVRLKMKKPGIIGNDIKETIAWARKSTT